MSRKTTANGCQARTGKEILQRASTVAEADEWLKPNEPMVLIEAGGEARAYPIQILIWHEIVNDTVGGAPVTVTFCPLCNTAIAFERTVGGRVLDFGTTGRLRFSNLIMYDRQTETWWQQATGAAIAGELIGTQLVFHPAAIIAWSDFKAAHASGKVLSRDTAQGPNSERIAGCRLSHPGYHQSARSGWCE
jgi:hypothetical protein